MGDEIRVTVIATGIDETKKERKSSRPAKTNASTQTQSLLKSNRLDMDQRQTNHC